MKCVEKQDIIDPKSTMNKFSTIKMYTIYTQQQDTNSIQGPIDYTQGDIGTYPGTIRQGAKISWSKGIEIIQSLFSYHCGINNKFFYRKKSQFFCEV